MLTESLTVVFQNTKLDFISCIIQKNQVEKGCKDKINYIKTVNTLFRQYLKVICSMAKSHHVKCQ